MENIISIEVMQVILIILNKDMFWDIQWLLKRSFMKFLYSLSLLKSNPPKMKCQLKIPLRPDQERYLSTNIPKRNPVFLSALKTSTSGYSPTETKSFSTQPEKILNKLSEVFVISTFPTVTLCSVVS